MITTKVATDLLLTMRVPFYYTFWGGRMLIVQSSRGKRTLRESDTDDAIRGMDEGRNGGSSRTCITQSVVNHDVS
jgi:hypothetical protein